MAGYEDCYAVAQFSSLSAVITHALSPEDDREAAYDEAGDAMVLHGRWRGYRMMFSPKLRFHIGYRFENPKDWFLLLRDADAAQVGEIEGPFRAKKSILAKLRVKRSNVVRQGVYTVDRYTLFTRDQAESLNVDSEALPV